MRLGVRRDADREVADLAHEMDELDRVVQLTRRQIQVGRRVTAEREDVLDPGLAVALDDRPQLGPGVAHAGEMRHRRHLRVAQDPGDDLVGLLPRRPAGAVGDRDVRRAERLELLERGGEGDLGLGRAGREELERVARPPSQDLGDLHNGERVRDAPLGVAYFLPDVDFTLHQQIDAPADAIDGALVDPVFLARMDELPKLGSADVVSNDRDGDVVRLAVRYLFQAELSSAVTRVVDPDKLTWVEESTCDLAAHHTTCQIVPDNYANLLQGSYEATIGPSGSGSQRTITGRIKVKVPLLGGKVEKAIVGGLSENADAQAILLTSFISGQ